MNDKHKETNSEVMAFTGERFVPEVHGNIELEHVHRYLQACEIAAGKVVLDIACGEGYGSAMLARMASKVIGVDISADVIGHARKRYEKENLEFLVGDCGDIPLADASVDLIVSFETIEHHDQHEKMMQEVKRVLRPKGVVLISSPDKFHYSVELGSPNPYHVRELYQHEFKQLLGRYFENVAYFGQRIMYGSGIFAESLPTPAVTYLQENDCVKEAPGIIKPIYWIALASDGPLPGLASGVFEQPIDESDTVQSAVAERDGQITARDNQIDNLKHAVIERDGQITARDSQIDNLKHAVTERDSEIARLHQGDREQKQKVDNLISKYEELTQQIEHLSAETLRWSEQEEQFRLNAERYAEELQSVHSTLAWKLLDRYRRLRNSSAILSWVHSGITGPIKRIASGKKDQQETPKQSDASERILIFRSSDLDKVYTAIRSLRQQLPDCHITLALPEVEKDLFGGWPGVDDFCFYRASRGLLRGVVHLLRELRGKTFDRVVLPSSAGERSPLFSLFIFLSTFTRTHERCLMDDNGTTQLLAGRHSWISLADVVGFCLGLLPVTALTSAICWCARPFAEKKGRVRLDDGTLAILVPILPDLSHTFIYRELLSLLDQFGRQRKIMIVALEKGKAFPIHEEAKKLLAHAVYVPSCSLTKYLALYSYYLTMRPLRMSRLIASYRSESGNDPWMFLRLHSFHGLHPSRGIPLAHLLDREDVSYIHCFGTSYPATRALVAATLLDVQFSFSTFVDFDYDYAFKSLDAKSSYAKFLVTCTQFCRQRLLVLSKNATGGKIKVIHHGLDPALIQATPRGSGQSSSTRVGVYIACRLVEKKGLSYLIQALALLKERGSIVTCSIIGDGPERESLQALVTQLELTEEIRFPGPLPNQEIQNHIGAQDICVVPAINCSDGERDGIPVVLLEALANGHAVISTDVSGIPELIEHEKYGLLVPERDTEALAQAIRRLAMEPELRLRLIAAGQQRLREKFNIHEKAKLLWNLIHDQDADAVEKSSPETSRLAAPHTVRRKPTVSAVFVNYNGAKFFEPLFASIRRQTYPFEEVFLFDNGSVDGSADLAQQLMPQIDVVRFDRNTGYSFPVNEGIRRSSGDYVLVLNVDLLLEDTFVENLVGALERHPTAGWASGKLLKLTASGKSDQIDCLGHHMSKDRYAKETDYSRPFDWKDYQEESFVFGASAAAALYRRTMLDDIKVSDEYFDEDFFAYFEDVDVDWRAQLRGWKCLYVPAAVGYHMRGGTGLIKRPQIAACYLANRWLMLIKNDTIGHFVPDMIPVSYRLLRDGYGYLKTNPWSLVLAGVRFAKYLPVTLVKRASIQRNRLVSQAYLRKLIR